MKSLFIILLFPFLINAQRSDAYHFYTGCFISIGTSEVIYHYTYRNGLSCLTGAATGVAAGAFKEFVWDGYLKKGTKTWPDFFITTQGAVSGSMFDRCWQDWRERKRQNRRNALEYKKHLLD